MGRPARPLNQLRRDIDTVMGQVTTLKRMMPNREHYLTTIVDSLYKLTTIADGLLREIRKDRHEDNEGE